MACYPKNMPLAISDIRLLHKRPSVVFSRNCLHSNSMSKQIDPRSVDDIIKCIVN